MGGEYYNPEIMRSANTTELHRNMSWVMAESGVPWEENDDAWCCPECFILYSLNVFRVSYRGEGGGERRKEGERNGEPPSPSRPTGRKEEGEGETEGGS